jgi:ATP-dependent DNA helicase RecG
LNAARSPAHQRLVCEEFLSLQTVLQLQRTQEKKELLGPEMIFDEASVATILETLPFRLTPGQDDALRAILADMKSRVPMHRLLQGDVGCGKTAVAGGALLAAATAGYQAAIMAPTELLARQHSRWLAPWAASQGMNLACLTGTTSSVSKQQILDGLANGDIKILVGTHALLEPEVLFSKLGLAVIDEQHRFGVRQRASLREKGKADHQQCPHFLVMTATPIPRTLELTVYGDLDVCTIDDMPPGRQPIVSQVVPAANWDRVVEMLIETVHRGEQAYVVAPRIKDGDGELSTAVQLQAELQHQLGGVRIGLLHGRQAQDERSSTMESFRAGQIDVLASTTVVEVGVDVSNATLMVIGHAERFGLAQLHQLRGRVGRGSAQATCVFLAHEPLSENAQLRLDAVQSTTDGFELAEKDLSLRGPGELLGTRQAGVTGFRVGDPFRDHKWLEVTCEEAQRLVEAEDDESIDYCQRIQRYWGRQFAMTQTGLLCTTKKM